MATFTQVTQVNSHNGFAKYNSTINIVLVIIISITVKTFLSLKKIQQAPAYTAYQVSNQEYDGTKAKIE